MTSGWPLSDSRVPEHSQQGKRQVQLTSATCHLDIDMCVSPVALVILMTTPAGCEPTVVWPVISERQDESDAMQSGLGHNIVQPLHRAIPVLFAI